MLGILQSRQVAQCPRVGEVHLRRLDKPLPDVREVGPQHDDLVGGFQHGQPRLDRVDRHPQIPGDIGQAQKLRAPGRKDPEEVLVLGETSDLAQRPHVSFEIGLEVAGVPEGDVSVRVCGEFRIPAPEDVVPQRAESRVRGLARVSGPFPRGRLLRAPGDLPLRQGKEPQHRRASRERLRNPVRQQQVLRTRQEVLAGCGTVAVDPLLDVREKFRRVLHLIEDDGRPMGLEKAARIPERGCPNVRWVERDVAITICEEVLQKRRLAGLAWSRQDHRGEFRRGRPDNGLQRTPDVPRPVRSVHESILCIDNANIQLFHRALSRPSRTPKQEPGRPSAQPPAAGRRGIMIPSLSGGRE